MWDLIVSVPDHCLSFNLLFSGTVFKVNMLNYVLTVSKHMKLNRIQMHHSNSDFH